MAQDLDIIRRFVRRLVWRERAVLAADIVARTLLLAFVALLLLVLAPLLDWDRGGTAAALVLIGGVGLWASIALPLLLNWRPTGDALRQARLTEARHPELGGRLVTAVERVNGPQGGESEALLGLVVRRAVGVLQTVHPSRIHRGLRQAALLLVAVFLVWVPLPLSFFAGGPVDVARWWAQGFEANAAVAALQLGALEEEVQVGDLVLRYTYPAYTGLEPRVVENSTGDAQGPPGTQVALTARSADRIEAAGLVAYEERLEARVRDERMVDAAFTISAEEGAYHLITYQGEASKRSRDFQIVPEEDLAPEVIVDGESEVLELAVDEDFQLIWRARDDYGIDKVQIRIDGVAAKSLYQMEERRAEVFGDFWTSPGELGLLPGMEVELDLAAWDNDTFSGSKIGVSRSLKLVVLSARGLDARNEAQLEKLREAMLTVLADHLVEAWPVGTASGDFALWGEAVAKRYQPLQELVEAEWDRLGPDSLERVVIGEVIETGGELVRYTAVAFEPGSRDMAQPAAVSDTETYRDAAIEALEDGILAIDRMLRNKALREVVEIAERVDELGQDLEQMMASDETDPLEMLAQLEQLEAMMQQLAEAASKLQDGGLREFVNARQSEMSSLMEEIRKAIQEGRMDDARKLMDRLASQLQQMAEGVRDTLERQQGESDDSMDQARALTEELERLEGEQRELQEQVRKIREEADLQSAEQAERIWKQIQAESARLRSDVAAYRDALVENRRGFNEQQRAESGVRSVDRLLESAGRRDLRGSRAAHRSSLLGVDSMYRAMEAARLGRKDLPGPARRELEGFYTRLDEIEALLDRLVEQPVDERLSEQARQLEQEQRELQESLEQAKQKAEELSQSFPVRPKDMGESLESAEQRMGEAQQDLQQGQPMSAEGSQGAAADRIKEARESLEQAMQQAQQQAQQLQPSQGDQAGGQQTPRRKGEDSNRMDQMPEIEIPGAEEFQSPEAYRRALLEGMEGEVPEEFRAMKKRYFEELVSQ